MSATSDTEIGNLALSRVGNKRQISSLTEGTTEADLVNLHYARTRNSVLRMHPWNFAIRRVALAQISTTPAFEFDYYYALPSDCLKVIRTSWEADGSFGTAIYGFPGLVGGYQTQVPYRIESVSGVAGRVLACNESTVYIEYIAEITDVSLFDELFVDILAQRLAAEIAPALTDNASLTKGLWDVYSFKITDARLADATEGTSRDVVDVTGWLGARA